ncbi:MAG TPA: heme o synthase [Longimicrobiales bacterium]|nr:heme o synthase [Longimicrobiales bacterium]
MSGLADATRTLPARDRESDPGTLPTFRAHARFQGVFRDYWEMAKPGISFFIVLTAAAGYYLGNDGPLAPLHMLRALVGIGLTAAGAGVLNHYVERGTDARMVRTSNRPLPAERVRPAPALAYGILLGSSGFLLLLFGVGSVPALFAGASLLIYIFGYTPLKRRSPAATLVGAVPGALPALAGWTASGAPIDVTAIAVFATVYFWQIPHFLALAWICKEDYRRGEFKMLVVADATGRRTGRHASTFAAALMLASISPFLLGRVGTVYFGGVLLLSAVMVAASIAFLSEPTRRTARRLFLSSLVFVPGWMLLVLLDKR